MNTSQDTIDWLAALAERGLSASQIANVMKRSRNSVIGLCDRNGIKLQGGVELPATEEPVKRRVGRPKGIPVSQEHRKRLSDAQRARWGAVPVAERKVYMERARNARRPAGSKDKVSRNVSPEVRAARSERMKQLWAAARAQQAAE